MNIRLNGDELILDAPTTIAKLIDDLGYGDRRVAVARNGDFVPKAAYAATSVAAGDEVEIVQPLQGG